MTQFEVGKSYECNDCGISPITIIKRTTKTCLVKNNDGSQWRMLVRIIDDNEVMIDSSVPRKWRDTFTYDSRFATED